MHARQRLVRGNLLTRGPKMVIMTIMRQVTVLKSVGVAEAKAKLSELLGRVAHRDERIVIERWGKPVAALVPVGDLKQMRSDTERDWLDDVLGMCADCPEFCDELDKIVAERRTEMPGDVAFPWDDRQ